MNDFSEAAGLRDYPLARRGLMMSGLISGFTLAVERVEAQTITTDTNGLDAGEAPPLRHRRLLPSPPRASLRPRQFPSMPRRRRAP